MSSYLPELIKNPLIVAGILMALAIVVYFSLEHRHMIHKTKRERATILLGWGFFLAAMALVSLFTTSLHVIAGSAGLLPPELKKEMYTLDKADKLCSQLISEGSISKNYIEGCQLIRNIYYGAYAILAVALLLLVTGFFKQLNAAKGESVKEGKGKKEVKETQKDKEAELSG